MSIRRAYESFTREKEVQDIGIYTLATYEREQGRYAEVRITSMSHNFSVARH